MQKNVYRACAGNCDEIASVTTFHRNDKGLATSSELSSRTQCGDLTTSWHGERVLASRPSVSKEFASTTPQVWLVAGSHLGFAKKAFHSIASDKKCRQVLSQVTKLACERQSKKNSSQIIFSKIKVRLKLSCKSVGQGRGSLEGTVRPSQLKALSLLHRKILANPKTCYGEGKTLSEVFFFV